MKAAPELFLSLMIVMGPVFAQGLSVNFDDAKIVYIDENHMLKKIDDLGNVSAVLNPDVAVTYMHASEQSNLFLVFQGIQQFSDGKYYLLAQVTPADNTISGIDTNCPGIAWDRGSGLSPGVQSDSFGNLYYLAYQSAGLVLKKCVGGSGTDIVNLINDNINIYEWLVRSDGTILMGGNTVSSGSYWLRKLTPDSNLSSLALNARATFLLDFPDDRVYAGSWGDASYYGVYRLPVALTNFDGNTPYIGGNYNSPEYDVNDLTNGHGTAYSAGLTAYCGSSIAKWVKTTDGRMIVLAGAQEGSKTVAQYYPAPPKIIEPTLIDSPTVIGTISNLLLVAGTKNSVNKLILYDLTTSNETSLLDEDIEIYHLQPLDDGSVWLDGLKYNGNRYVVGKIPIIINPALRGAVKSVGQFQEMATLSGKPNDLAGCYGAPAPVVGPVIKANGSASDISINHGANLSITVQLNPGEYEGLDADWWIVARAGASWYYLDSAIRWTPFDGNLSNCHPVLPGVLPGALFNLSATEVLNMTGLPVGSYTFYFAVDSPMDGILNLSPGHFLCDAVNVTIQ